MKWKSDEAMKRGDNAGSLTLLTIGLKNGWSRDATPADIIAALKANPEARAEVLDALGGPPASRRLDVAAAIARAEQAERDRGQWRAKWEALETTRAACCGQMERERDEARAERDSVLDRLAGAREARDAASDDAEALRAKLARFESVTAAARLLLGKLDSPGNFPRYGREHEGIRNALRALDNDSGGSGAAHDGGRLMPDPTVATAGPPALAGGCGHKRRRCENDHDVCVDCGAVNRAVTGLADWGPAAPAGASAAARCVRGCVVSGVDASPFAEATKPVRDSEAPATRREVEELRRRIDRLESLTDNEE